MSIGEGIFAGCFVLGGLAFVIGLLILDYKSNKEHREFKKSVKESLIGIKNELHIMNLFNVMKVEEKENEN